MLARGLAPRPIDESSSLSPNHAGLRVACTRSTAYWATLRSTNTASDRRCSAISSSRLTTWPACGGLTAIRSMIVSSSAAVGWSRTIFIMKRSRWASGSWYTPSLSIGFCVATTKNGAGTGWVIPPIVTWCSCITSSSADWTLAGARLISSVRRKLTNTGPSSTSKRSLLPR